MRKALTVLLVGIIIYVPLVPVSAKPHASQIHSSTSAVTAKLTVGFDDTSARLSKADKKKIKDFFSAHPSLKSVKVTGYVQQSETSANNYSLSRSRAHAIKAYLRKLGVDAKIIKTRVGLLPNYKPWSKKSRKAVIALKESSSSAVDSHAGNKITIASDVLTVRFAELSGNYKDDSGTDASVAFTSKTKVVYVDKANSNIHIFTTGTLDYVVKKNGSDCPVVFVAMSAYFDCSNLTSGSRITITHNPVTTVRVVMSSNAGGGGHQVASYYTGPSGDTYQDGMTFSQDIEVASGAHTFNIVTYYETSQMFIVKLNGSINCTFSNSTSSTWSCPGVKAGDIINVYQNACGLPLFRAELGNDNKSRRACLR